MDIEGELEDVAFKMYVDAIKELRKIQNEDNDIRKVYTIGSCDVSYGIDTIIDNIYRRHLNDLYRKYNDLNILSEHYSYPIRENAKYFVLIDPVDGSRELMRDERAAYFIFAWGEWKGKETTLSDIKGVALGRLPTSRECIYEFIVVSENKEPTKYIYNILKQPYEEINSPKNWKSKKMENNSVRDIEHTHICFVAPFYPYRYTATIADEFYEEVKKRFGKKELFNEQYLTTAGQMIGMIEGKLSMIVDIRPSIKANSSIEMLCAHPYDVPAAYLIKKLGGVVVGKDFKEETFWNQKIIPLNRDIEFIAFPNKEIFEKYGGILRSIIEKKIIEKS